MTKRRSARRGPTSPERSPAQAAVRTAARAANAADTAAPTLPPPAWFDPLAPRLAVCYLALALATIPYGRPPELWYVIITTAFGLAVISAAFMDTQRRWKSITWWPIPAILGAWALSIIGCQFPMVSLERSMGMGLYSIVFIAAQVVTWSRRTRDLLALVVLLLVLSAVLDLVWELLTTRSLFTDTRMGGSLQHRLVPVSKGSQGNPNDLASVSVLLPLCLTVVHGAPRLVVYAAVCLCAAPTWILTRSRQVLLGWIIATATPLVAQLSRKRAALVAVATCSFVALAILLIPALRDRFVRSVENPLTGRGMVLILGLDLFVSHPIAGIGPALFGHHHTVAVGQGWSWRGHALEPVGTPWVHSLPIEVLCELGIAGATAIGAAVFAACRHVWRAMRHLPSDRDWTIGIVSASLAFLGIGLIDMSFIKDWVRICFWLLLGLSFANSIGPSDVRHKAGSKAASRGGEIQSGTPATNAALQ